MTSTADDRGPVPFLISAGAGERLPFAGMEFAIRASAETTGGAFSIIEEINAVDAPPDIHRNEDGLFFVLEARRVFTAGFEEFEAGPGDTVYVPRGTRHAQRRVVPRQGRTLSMFSPAGFEQFFRDISAADVAGTLDERTMATITEQHGAVWVD